VGGGRGAGDQRLREARACGKKKIPRSGLVREESFILIFEHWGRKQKKGKKEKIYESRGSKKGGIPQQARGPSLFRGCREEIEAQTKSRGGAVITSTKGGQNNAGGYRSQSGDMGGQNKGNRRKKGYDPLSGKSFGVENGLACEVGEGGLPIPYGVEP